MKNRHFRVSLEKSGQFASKSWAFGQNPFAGLGILPIRRESVCVAREFQMSKIGAVSGPRPAQIGKSCLPPLLEVAKTKALCELARNELHFGPNSWWRC